MKALYFTLGLMDIGYQTGICVKPLTYCATHEAHVIKDESYQSTNLQAAYSKRFSKISYWSLGLNGGYETHDKSKLYNRAYLTAKPELSVFTLNDDSNYGLTLFPAKVFTTQGKRETNRVIKGMQLIPEVAVWIAYPIN